MKVVFILCGLGNDEKKKKPTHSSLQMHFFPCGFSPCLVGFTDAELVAMEGQWYKYPVTYKVSLYIFV